MALPKAVKDMAKKSEELYKELYEKSEIETEEHEEEKKEEEEVEKPSTEEKEEGEDTGTTTEEEEESHTPEVKTEKEDAGETKPEVESEAYDKLKQAHSTLQGKYNSEIATLQKQVKGLELLLTNVTTQSETKKKEEEEGVKTSKLMEAQNKLKEEYSDETLKSLETLLESFTDKRLAPVLESLQQIKTSSNKSQEETYYDRVGAKVADYEAVASLPDFQQDFLSTKVPFMKKTYNELLNEAYGNKDVSSTVEIFNAYKQSRGLNGKEENKGKTEKEEKAIQLKEKLKKSQGIPSKKGETASKLEDGKRIFTGKEVKEFYQKKANKKLKMPPKEIARLEKEIFRANMEGRIIN